MRSLAAVLVCLATAPRRAHGRACVANHVPLAVLIRCPDADPAPMAAARTSWAHASPTEGASKACSPVRFWFVVGGAAAPHAEGDILKVDAPDGYDTLNLKVIAGLRWLVRQRDFTYDHVLVSKTDAFVCVGALLRFVIANKPLYSGLPDHGAMSKQRKIIKRKGHKWSDPHYATTFQRDTYADYMQGVGYTLSSALAKTVVRNAEALNIGMAEASAVEDAWIGALARYVVRGPHSAESDSSGRRLEAAGEEAPAPKGRSLGKANGKASGKGHGGSVRLSANRSLVTEKLVPTAQWVDAAPDKNITRSCSHGFVLVHRLTSPELLECAQAAKASPPYCHVKAAGYGAQTGPVQADKKPLNGVMPQRCACDDYREKVRGGKAADAQADETTE